MIIGGRKPWQKETARAWQAHRGRLLRCSGGDYRFFCLRALGACVEDFCSPVQTGCIALPYSGTTAGRSTYSGACGEQKRRRIPCGQSRILGEDGSREKFLFLSRFRCRDSAADVPPSIVKICPALGITLHVSEVFSVSLSVSR